MRIPTQSPKEQRCDQLQEERWDPASTEHSGFVMAGGDGSHWRWDEKKKKISAGMQTHTSFSWTRFSLLWHSA